MSVECDCGKKCKCMRSENAAKLRKNTAEKEKQEWEVRQAMEMKEREAQEKKEREAQEKKEREEQKKKEQEEREKKEREEREEKEREEKARINQEQKQNAHLQNLAKQKSNINNKVKISKQTLEGLKEKRAQRAQSAQTLQEAQEKNVILEIYNILVSAYKQLFEKTKLFLTHKNIQDVQSEINSVKKNLDYIIELINSKIILIGAKNSPLKINRILNSAKNTLFQINTIIEQKSNNSEIVYDDAFNVLFYLKQFIDKLNAMGYTSDNSIDDLEKLKEAREEQKKKEREEREKKEREENKKKALEEKKEHKNKVHKEWEEQKKKQSIEYIEELLTFIKKTENDTRTLESNILQSEVSNTRDADIYETVNDIIRDIYYKKGLMKFINNNKIHKISKNLVDLKSDNKRIKTFKQLYYKLDSITDALNLIQKKLTTSGGKTRKVRKNHFISQKMRKDVKRCTRKTCGKSKKRTRKK